MRRWIGLVAGALLALTLATSKSSLPVAASLDDAPSTFAPSPASSAIDDGQDADPGDCPPLDTAPHLDALRRLPWPVVLETACGRFVASPTGLAMAPADPGAVADPGYRVTAGPDAWASVQRGHVVFVQRGSVVWRSEGDQYDALNLGSAVLGSGWLAFTMSTANGPAPLYLATGAGPERVIGFDQEPLMATRWGFFASRWGSNGDSWDLVTRGADGSPVRVIARNLGAWFPHGEGTLIYQARGKLWRTDGTASRLFADLSFLGRQRYVGVQPLEDGRIVVNGLEKVAVLRSNGRIQSRASLPPISKGGWGYIGVFGVDPTGAALVMTATRWADERAGGGPGWEGVYLLHPGATSANLLFGWRLDLAVCAHSAAFSWRGRWLLYSTCEGRAVAIDTSGRHQPVVLTGLGRIVPEPKAERAYGLYGATWAAFGTDDGRRTALALRSFRLPAR